MQVIHDGFWLIKLPLLVTLIIELLPLCWVVAFPLTKEFIFALLGPPMMNLVGELGLFLRGEIRELLLR